MTRILVAVNDSASALAAAEAAIGVAVRLGADLRVVTVIDPISNSMGVRQADLAALVGQREREADSVLKHVAMMGSKAGLVVGTNLRTGKVASEILDEARVVGADLIVMALVDRPGHAVPKVGSHTMRVLEFASVPVLVVPGRTARATDHSLLPEDR